MSVKVIRPDFGATNESVATDLQKLAGEVRSGDAGSLRRAVLVLEDSNGDLSFEVLGASINTAELTGLMFLVMQDVASKSRGE